MIQILNDYKMNIFKNQSILIPLFYKDKIV
jgi:hypothetical protein